MNKEALTAPALEALLQAPSLAVHAVDKHGCVILWSSSASRMFGWTESEMLGRFLPIVPEKHRQEVYDRIQCELKGDTASALDVRSVRKDGSPIDVSLWSTPLRDSRGEVIGILCLYADITARKRAEEALKKSQAELQQVFTAVSDYIWSGQFDADGRFSYRYNSPAAERILGRPAEFFLTGQGRWQSIVHPEDRPRAAQAAVRLRTGQSDSEDEEYRIVMPDGAIRWVRNSVTASQSPDGLRCLNGVVTDITARKRAEEARQQAAAELRRVLAAVSDCLYSGEFDSDGRFIYHYYSPAAERILGRPPLFFLAGPERWLSAIHPEDRPRLVRAFARLRTGQWASAEEEYRFVLPDGTTRWVRDSVTLSQGMDGRHFVNGVVSDITARKRAEEALQESERELRRVLDAASDYFWSGDVDPDGRFHYRYYSPAVERITGRPAEFYMAGDERWMSTVHPEDRVRIAEVSDQLLSGQSNSTDNEHRIVLPDGTIRWVHANVTVSPSADGHRRLDGVVSDITERKQAEERLEERVRERTAELVEANETMRLQSTALQAAANGIVITECDGRILWVNPAFTKLTGYKLSEVIGQNPRVLQSGQHDKAFYEDLWRTVLSGRVWHGEMINKRKDGSLYTEEMTITPVRDAAGGITHFIAIKQDITESKLAEQTRQRLAAIVESSDDAIVSANLDGTITSWNAGAQRLYNYAPEEIVGRSISALIPRNHRGALREILKKLRRGEHIQHYETIRLKKGGIPFDVSISVSPTKNAAGQVVGISAITRDITERKLAEVKLATLARAVESTTELICITDLHDRFYFVNPAFQRAYGYTEAELLGKSPQILYSSHNPTPLGEIFEQTRGGGWQGDVVDRRKNGTEFPVHLSTSVIKDQTGRVIGLMGVAQDITERKSLERAVVEASSREQARIGQDLHDGLCQQLTGISFLWKTVAESVAGQALPEAAAVAEIAQLITKTIGEARDLAHRLCPVELEHNNLGVALKTLGLSMERQFAVSCVVRCQQPVLLTDKTVAAHLYRIAQEAISNAIHHGKAARVWIHLGWKNDRLTLRIRDNGSGFSKRRGFQEGIGMRSMKYRARAISGLLAIESKRGAGTTVVCVYTERRSRFGGKARRHSSG